MKKCKRCLTKPTLTEEDISKMLEQVCAMPGIRLADENVYEKRMEICGGCEKLEYGTTCMLCGCVMQVRARLLDGRCPKKLWNFGD